jgi:hypothetical protein
MVEATNISKEPGDRSELLIARDCFQPGRCRLLVPWARTVPAASAVDEAVVAHSVPRSGCNVAGGPSDKPGYEAKLVRSIGTSATGAIATHSDDRRLLSTKYTKSTDWWRNQNKDMTGFKVNSW